MRRKNLWGKNPDCLIIKHWRKVGYFGKMEIVLHRGFSWKSWTSWNFASRHRIRYQSYFYGNSLRQRCWLLRMGLLNCLQESRCLGRWEDYSFEKSKEYVARGIQKESFAECRRAKHKKNCWSRNIMINSQRYGRRSVCEEKYFNSN